MSAQAMPWQEATQNTGAPPAPWEEAAKSSGAQKTEEPGFLDKEIPLAGSWYNPTLSGVQSIGRGVRTAARGIAALPGQAYSDVTSGHIPVIHELGEGIRSTASQIPQIPQAVHDINASPDSVGTYAHAAQETAGQGAGQALTALATEGVAKAAPPIARAAKPFVGKALTTASDIVDPELTGVLSPRLANAQKLAGRVGRVLTKSSEEKGPLPEELDATGENKAYAGAPRPKLEKELDATGENKPFAGGMDEAPAGRIDAGKINAPQQKLGPIVHSSKLPTTELEHPVIGRASEMASRYPVERGALGSPSRIVSPIEEAQPPVNTPEATDWHNQALQAAKEKLGPQAPIGQVLQEAAKIQQAGPGVIAPEYSPAAQGILGRMNKNLRGIRAQEAVEASEPDDLAKMLQDPDFIGRSIEAVKQKRLAAQKPTIQ